MAGDIRNSKRFRELAAFLRERAGREGAKLVGGEAEDLEGPADGGCADPVAELEQLALDPLVSPAVVVGGERSISLAISALTGGRPIRFG